MIGKVELIFITSTFAAFSAFSADLLSVDFESMTVGEKTTATSVSPTVNDSFNFNTVVDSSVNVAGAGKGTQFYDNSITGTTKLQFDLTNDVSVTALRFDFNVAPLTNYGGTQDYIAACVVQNGASAGTGANRYAEVRMYANGELRFYSAGSYIPSSSILLALNEGRKVSLFVNDSDSDILNYSGVRTLAANSVDYWVDNGFYISGDLNGISAGTTDGLGRVGFSSSTDDINLDYVFDDIMVTDVVAGPSVDYLLFEDYEGQSEGALPGGANVRPTSPTSILYCEIVNAAGNPMGTGQGVNLKDENPDSNQAVSMEYNFVSAAAKQVSAVRLDIDFAYITAAGAGDKPFYMGFGQWNSDRSLNSNSKRYTDARFYNDGTIDFRRNGVTNSYPDSQNNALLPGANTLSMFVNDYDTQFVEYTGLDGATYSLPANSAAYWLNGDLVMMTSDVLTNEYITMDLEDPTADGLVGNTEDNLGKFGFYSGSSETDLNYVFDNVLITTNLLVDTYEEWISLFPALGANTNYLDDGEAGGGDGVDNLSEYAYGGNPTVDDAASILPTYNVGMDGGSNWLNYVYLRRDNASAFGLTYTVYSDTDLVTGTMTTPTEEAGSTMSATSGIDVVTNRVSISASPQAFMQLQIEID